MFSTDEHTLNIKILPVAQRLPNQGTQGTMNRLGLCVGVVYCCLSCEIKKGVAVRHSYLVFLPPPPPPHAPARSLWAKDTKLFLLPVSFPVRVKPKQSTAALQLFTTNGAMLTCHSKQHTAFTSGRGNPKTLRCCVKICASTLKGLKKRRPPCLAPTRLFFSGPHSPLTWTTLAMGNTSPSPYPSVRAWAAAKEVMWGVGPMPLLLTFSFR
jgi:hypothetical protein